MFWRKTTNSKITDKSAWTIGDNEAFYHGHQKQNPVIDLHIIERLYQGHLYILWLERIPHGLRANMEYKHVAPHGIRTGPPRRHPQNQCCGSMTFWCGFGSGSADPCLWLMDPDADPDPAISFSAYYLLKVHLQHCSELKFDALAKELSRQLTHSIYRSEMEEISFKDPWHFGVDPDPDLDPQIHATD